MLCKQILGGRGIEAAGCEPDQRRMFEEALDKLRLALVIALEK